LFILGVKMNKIVRNCILTGTIIAATAGSYIIGFEKGRQEGADEVIGNIESSLLNDAQHQFTVAAGHAGIDNFDVRTGDGIEYADFRRKLNKGLKGHRNEPFVKEQLHYGHSDYSTANDLWLIRKHKVEIQPAYDVRR
jgi:hypothetical protein